MAVMTDYMEIVRQACEVIGDYALQDRKPQKVLMSKRQLDALNAARFAYACEHPDWARRFAKRCAQNDMQPRSALCGLPIVICPDCDFYVV